MNDEIKEIREYISCPQFDDDHYGKWGALRLDQRKKIKDLLDYITNLQQYYNDNVNKYEELIEKYSNLQQELEEYKDTETYSKRFLYKANKDRLNANLDLIKENERLKDELNKKHTMVTFNYTSDVYEELEDYKSRIEKAVEYIKGSEKQDFIWTPIFEKELLNILNGKE